MSHRNLLRRTVKTPGILFEWLATVCHKSFMLSMFLFEWKTSV